MNCRLLLLFCVLFLAGCASGGGKDASTASLQIKKGMPYSEVVAIASEFEFERTFKGRGTALQFCDKKSNWKVDGNYVVVWLVDDVVEGLTQYGEEVRTLKECDEYFREIDWGQAPYDVKVKLDID